MTQMDMTYTGRWAVALERNSNGSVLRFEFTDAPPITLLIPKDDALKIAEAIRAQYETAPLTRHN